MIEAPPHPKHVALCTRNSYLPTPERPFMTITGGKHAKAWTPAAAAAMGVPWMETIREVCEALPPAYTEYIGAALMRLLKGDTAASRV